MPRKARCYVVAVVMRHAGIHTMGAESTACRHVLERDPMLVDLLERAHPVVEDLGAQGMSADATDVLVATASAQMVMSHEDVVNVLDFERDVVGAGLGVSHDETHMVIHRFLAS